MVLVGRFFREVFAKEQASLQGGIEDPLVGQARAWPSVEVIGRCEDGFSIVVIIPFRHFYAGEDVSRRLVETAAHPQEKAGVSRSLQPFAGAVGVVGDGFAQNIREFAFPDESPKPVCGVDIADRQRAGFGKDVFVARSDPVEYFGPRAALVEWFCFNPTAMLLRADVVDICIVTYFCPVGGTTPEIHPIHGGHRETETLMPGVVARSRIGQDITGKGMDRVEVGAGAVLLRGLGPEVVLEQNLISVGGAEDRVINDFGSDLFGCAHEVREGRELGQSWDQTVADRA